MVTQGRPIDAVTQRIEHIALVPDARRVLRELDRLLTALAADAVRANELEASTDSETAA